MLSGKTNPLIYQGNGGAVSGREIRGFLCGTASYSYGGVRLATAFYGTPKGSTALCGSSRRIAAGDSLGRWVQTAKTWVVEHKEIVEHGVVGSWLRGLRSAAFCVGQTRRVFDDCSTPPELA